MKKCKLCPNKCHSKHGACLYCKDCAKERNLMARKRHRKRWIKANKAHLKSYRQEHYDDFKPVRNAKNKEHTRDLNDSYIVHLLCAKSTLNRADLTQELIDMKRLEVELLRERRSNNAKNNGTQSKETSSEDCKGL